MHGPFIFAFEASSNDIQNIITKNKLRRYEEIPEFVNSLLVHIDKHNLAWWQPRQELKQTTIYGKEDNSDYEPHLKFIFVDTTENRVYYLQI